MYEIWLVTLCWGLSFPLARILVADMDPLWITAFRFSLGGIGLVLISFFRGSIKNALKTSWKLILFLAIFEFFLVYFFYLTSIKYLPASKVAALTLTTPVIVLIFDSLFKKRMPVFKIMMPFILALFGAAILYDKKTGSDLLGDKQFLGFLCIMLSNISFAFANVILRPRLKSSSISVAGLAQLLAGIISISVSFAYKGMPSSIPLYKWGILIYLSIIATGMGFWFWNRSVNKLGALYPGLISNLKAPIAAILSVIIIKEYVPFLMWVGILALVLSATFAHTTIERVGQLKNIMQTKGLKLKVQS